MGYNFKYHKNALTDQMYIHLLGEINYEWSQDSSQDSRQDLSQDPSNIPIPEKEPAGESPV